MLLPWIIHVAWTEEPLIQSTLTHIYFLMYKLSSRICVVQSAKVYPPIVGACSALGCMYKICFEARASKRSFFLLETALVTPPDAFHADKEEQNFLRLSRSNVRIQTNVAAKCSCMPLVWQRKKSDRASILLAPAWNGPCFCSSGRRSTSSFLRAIGWVKTCSCILISRSWPARCCHVLRVVLEGRDSVCKLSHTTVLWRLLQV